MGPCRYSTRLALEFCASFATRFDGGWPTSIFFGGIALTVLNTASAARSATCTISQSVRADKAENNRADHSWEEYCFYSRMPRVQPCGSAPKSCAVPQATLAYHEKQFAARGPELDSLPYPSLIIDTLCRDWCDLGAVLDERSFGFWAASTPPRLHGFSNRTM